MYRESPPKEKKPFIWQQAFFKLFKSLAYAGGLSLVLIAVVYVASAGYGCGVKPKEPEECLDSAKTLNYNYSYCSPKAVGRIEGNLFICTCPKNEITNE